MLIYLKEKSQSNQMSLILRAVFGAHRFTGFLVYGGGNTFTLCLSCPGWSLELFARLPVDSTRVEQRTV